MLADPWVILTRRDSAIANLENPGFGVLDQGRITEDGLPAELIAGDGEYAALHSSWAASLA